MRIAGAKAYAGLARRHIPAEIGELFLWVRFETIIRRTTTKFQITVPDGTQNESVKKSRAWLVPIVIGRVLHPIDPGTIGDWRHSDQGVAKQHEKIMYV